MEATHATLEPAKRARSGGNVSGGHENFDSAKVSDARGLSVMRKSSCACGGGCPSCQSKSGGVKTSQPSDAAEIEADSIADRVMRMSIDDAHAKSNVSDSSNSVHRKCDACDDEEINETPVMRKEGFAVPEPKRLHDDIPSSIKNVVSSAGQPLDRETRNFFEPRFGADLSQVRIFTDGSASQSARSINARAYTLANSIVFNSGEYQPETEDGRHLIAHELAHTMQQSLGTSSVVSTAPHIARKPTSGRCGGWDCASDCKKTDAGDTPNTEGSTRHSMTIYVDIDVAEATDISSAEEVGHTYVKFNESNGDKYTYGFYHNKSKAPEPLFNPEVPGCVAHPDKTHWQCVDMEVNFDLTASEYKDGLNQAQSWCGAPPKYHITDRNCTTFVSKVADAAGKTLPSHRSKAGYGTFSQQADNPNALFDSYVSPSESKRWRGLVDSDFTGYYTRKGEPGTTNFTDFELDINDTFGVEGEYEFKRSGGEEVKGTINGHLEFKVDGATNTVRPILYFRWHDEGGASGLGKLRVMDSGGGGMVGTWGWDSDHQGGGDWILNKD